MYAFVALSNMLTAAIAKTCPPSSRRSPWRSTVPQERPKCAAQPLIVGTIESSTPAATAEPITPATFGPMACMSR